MKVKIDKSLCIGCGLCAGTCPAVFQMDDDGLAKAKEGTIEKELEADVETAAQDCPASAIKIEPKD